MDKKDIEALVLIKEIRDNVKENGVRLSELETLGAVRNSQLKEHMRRTETLEAEMKENRQFKWYFGGIAVIITALSSVVAKIIGVFI